MARRSALNQQLRCARQAALPRGVERVIELVFQHLHVEMQPMLFEDLWKAAHKLVSVAREDDNLVATGVAHR
jgi:hypothetical protein